MRTTEWDPMHEPKDVRYTQTCSLCSLLPVPRQLPGSDMETNDLLSDDPGCCYDMIMSPPPEVRLIFCLLSFLLT